MDKEIFEKLGKPFPARDVLWRIQKLSKKSQKGLAVPYLDARAVADRLDEVVGQNCWKDEYKPWHTYKTTVKEDGKSIEKEIRSQLCVLSIYDNERGEWVSKTDAAENSNIEPVKGGISDAFKRAAVKWNLGRYLYKMDSVWVEIDEYREITESEMKRLTNIYYKAVTRLFDKETTERLKAEEKLLSEPEQNGKQAKDNTEQPASKAKSSAPVYEVQNIAVNEGTNGKNSTLILVCGDKKYKTYMRGSDDRLKVGTKITNVKAEQKENQMGKYTVLRGFDMAA